jgi:hypothetical protein
MCGIDLAEGRMVLAEVLGLRDQLLPTRVSGKQRPLLPPATANDSPVQVTTKTKSTQEFVGNYILMGLEFSFKL